MKTARLLLAFITVVSGCSAASEQHVGALASADRGDVAAVEREVREFYAAYAENLRGHRREALADRYDPRGVFFLGNGKKRFRSFEENRSAYLTRWEGRRSFDSGGGRIEAAYRSPCAMSLSLPYRRVVQLVLGCTLRRIAGDSIVCAVRSRSGVCRMMPGELGRPVGEDPLQG